MGPKKWYQSKTIWVAVLQGALGVLLVLETQYPELGAIMMMKTVTDIALRMLTTEPVK